MREDFLERMEEMFPEGFVIVYTCPDGQVRMMCSNPQKLELLSESYEVLQSLEEKE